MSSALPARAGVSGAASAAAAAAAAPPPAGGTSVKADGAAAGEPSVLLVTHVQEESPASRVLRGGDVLLGVGGEAVRSLYAAEVAVNKAPPSLKLDVMRDGKPLTVNVETLSSDGLGTQRVVGFAGLLVQHVPDAVMAQRQVAPNGVYCAYRYYGSPSSRYDLPPTSRIVEVDAAPTPDLGAFLEQVTKKRDGEVLRVKYVDLEGRTRMTTLRLDLTYWPTFTLERGADGEWTRAEVAPPK